MRRRSVLTMLAALLLIGISAVARGQAPPRSVRSLGTSVLDCAEAPADWGPSIQQAIDSLRDEGGQSGGIISFPRGSYTIATPIVVRCPSVHLIGEGGPKSFACALLWRGDPSEAMFNFVELKVSKMDRSAGFCIEGFQLHAKKSGTAFRFGQSDKYSLRYRFSKIGVQYFKTVFEFLRSDPSPGGVWGGITVLDSELVYNGQVVSAVNGVINEWQFNRCLLSKNGLPAQGWEPTYAFDVLGGSNGAMYGCILESQPRALRVKQYQGLRIEGCRLEGNAALSDGDPVCEIEDCSDIYVQIYNRVLNAENHQDAPAALRLINCRNHRIDPMFGKVEIWRPWEPR